jgi:hypothetical protein
MSFHQTRKQDLIDLRVLPAKSHFGVGHHRHQLSFSRHASALVPINALMAIGGLTLGWPAIRSKHALMKAPNPPHGYVNADISGTAFAGWSIFKLLAVFLLTLEIATGN